MYVTYIYDHGDESMSNIDIHDIVSTYTITTHYTAIQHIPIPILIEILRYAIPTDGDEIIDMMCVCRLFNRLLRDNTLIPIQLHSGYTMYRNIPVQAIHIDISQWKSMNNTIMVCDTLTIYTSKRIDPYDKSLTAPLKNILNVVVADKIVVNSYINSIPYLYTYLDGCREYCSCITINTTTSYDGLLDKPSDHVHKRKYGEKILYTITLPRHLLDRQMYPSIQYLESVL